MLGETIKTARKAAHLTQRQLGEALRTYQREYYHKTRKTKHGKQDDHA